MHKHDAVESMVEWMCVGTRVDFEMAVVVFQLSNLPACSVVRQPTVPSRTPM